MNDEPIDPEFHQQSQEFLDEEQIRLQKEEEAHRQKLIAELKEFGANVDQDLENQRPAGVPENVLDALSDFSNARMIPIEGVEEIREAEKDPEPVRRTGEGPFTDYAERKTSIHDGKREKDPWVRVVPGLGEVRATEEHLEIYEDVFFTDDPLELPIKMKVGRHENAKEATVICRTLSAYEREVAAQAIQLAASTHPLLKNAPHHLLAEYVTRANMMMMVKSVEGKPWPYITCQPQEGVMAANDPTVKILAEKMTDYFGKTQGRQFALVAKALHAFEVIVAILDDGAINGDFTKPAD